MELPDQCPVPSPFRDSGPHQPCPWITHFIRGLLPSFLAINSSIWADAMEARRAPNQTNRAKAGNEQKERKMEAVDRGEGTNWNLKKSGKTQGNLNWSIRESLFKQIN